MRKYYITINNETPEKHEHKLFPGYNEYIEKYGLHFTEALAEKASKLMVNANSDKHSWSASQIKAAMAGFDQKISANTTLGDVTYLANMYYADLYPRVLETEAACIRAAVATANDPDGYEGQTFCRWKTDMEYKGHELNFEEFV